MKKNSLSPAIAGIGHIPRYSLIFLKALRTPLLLFIAGLGNLLLVVAAGLFYHYESDLNANVTNFFDAIWWAFTTVSTVGFGDITPVTIEGRVVGIFLMVTGVTLFVGFTAVFISIISSLAATDIVRGEELTFQEYKKLREQIESLQSQIDRIEKKLQN